MKKFVFIGLMVAFVASMAFAQQRFNSGTFTATAQGYAGAMTISVTFNATNIVAINVVSHSDTPAFANMVWNNLIPAIISAQSTNVDVISGATLTSRGLLQAVENAMGQASL
ncbi:MAG: FMN-binding protein [Spirochaetes bacterium]|nr:FMN-binding protein [Spirochaetota bacterium]